MPVALRDGLFDLSNLGGAMRTRRSPAGVRFGRYSQGGWAWLSWAVPAATAALDALTGRKAQKQAQELQQHNFENQLQIRAADARKAGLHPLAAIGGGGGGGPSFALQDPGWSDVGQHLGRAFLQGADQESRDDYLMRQARQAFRQGELQNESASLDVEMKRLQLQALQNQVSTSTSDPRLPGSAQAGGPGFRPTGIGFGTQDIGSSELSEWAEGMGLLGHAMVPYWMWQQSRDRAMLERSDAAKGPAFEAAMRELEQRRAEGDDGAYLERVTLPGGGHGWEIRRKGGYNDRATPRRKYKSLPDDTRLTWPKRY